MKKFQNDEIEVDGNVVVTTMTKLLVYKNGKLIGMSGCSKPSEFNFDELYSWAIHKSGSNIQVR